MHRFIKDEWRTLSSQTIGVEFASKIIKVGTGARRKRIKLQVCLPSISPPFSYRNIANQVAQLWDTAGTERFRSVSRSYYRGAAGAILVYDLTSHNTFTQLPAFLADARALASPNLTLLLVGNKADLAVEGNLIDTNIPTPTPSSVSSRSSMFPSSYETSSNFGSVRGFPGVGSQLKASTAPEGREVPPQEAAQWASRSDIPVSVEVSALSGEGVDEVFERLARMILTKIELGEIDPDDPQSGIQYGDGGFGGFDDADSVKSGGSRRRRRGQGGGAWSVGGLREWEEVFTLGNNNRRRGGGCC